MESVAQQEQVIDGATLKLRFRRAERRKRYGALLPVLPLLLFIIVTFLFPVGEMLLRSIDNKKVPNVLQMSAPLLQQWDASGDALPDDAVYEALLQDFVAGAKDKTITAVGQRLNYEVSGVSSLFRKTARRAKKIEWADAAEARELMLKIDAKWADVNIWRGIQRFSSATTAGYFLAATDYRYNPALQEYQKNPEGIYISLFGRTLFISLVITLLTLLLGYPVSFLLSNLPSKAANLLIIFVLLPFWTSLLVRTTSWIVLLQKEGVINDTLVALGIVGDGNRLEIIHNQTGTIVAMTHILLPFMILPLYSVMKTISPYHMRAARSLGANAFTAFRRVYFPQTIPGIGAGVILVFILAIGYYITPELVGGAEGTFISNRIAYHVRSSLNWGLAAALGAMLLVVVLVLYWCYDKIVGVDNMKLG